MTTQSLQQHRTYLSELKRRAANARDDDGDDNCTAAVGAGPLMTNCELYLRPCPALLPASARTDRRTDGRTPSHPSPPAVFRRSIRRLMTDGRRDDNGGNLIKFPATIMCNHAEVNGPSPSVRPLR